MAQCLALTRTADAHWPAPGQVTGMAGYRQFGLGGLASG
jgi:hypothetical protein